MDIMPLTVVLIRGREELIRETIDEAPFDLEVHGPGVSVRCSTRVPCEDERAYWAEMGVEVSPAVVEFNHRCERCEYLFVSDDEFDECPRCNASTDGESRQ